MHTGDYLTTISGRKFYPLDPRPEDVDIHDIAWSLSRICRFGGHVTSHYSVATHCVAMSYVVPEEDALWALLHDASEAYVGDMVKPLKKNMGLYMETEAKVISVIMEKYGLPLEMPESVRIADTGILNAERLLFTNQPVPDKDRCGLEVYTDAIERSLPKSEGGFVSVYMGYLSRFHELSESLVLAV